MGVDRKTYRSGKELAEGRMQGREVEKKTKRILLENIMMPNTLNTNFAKKQKP